MEGIGKVLCPHLLEVAVSGFHCKLSTDLCLFSLMLQYEWFSCANGRAVTGRRICCVYSTAAVANCYYSRQFYISLMPLSVLLPESQMFFILVPRLLWPSLTFFFFLCFCNCGSKRARCHLIISVWITTAFFSVHAQAHACSLHGNSEISVLDFKKIITYSAHLGILQWVRPI